MRTKLAAPDINCQACKEAIEGALGPVSGVETVEVDVAARVVDVAHGPGVDAAALARLVEEQGYEVSSVQEVS